MREVTAPEFLKIPTGWRLEGMEEMQGMNKDELQELKEAWKNEIILRVMEKITGAADLEEAKKIIRAMID